jgi:hypothetical protein
MSRYRETANSHSKSFHGFSSGKKPKAGSKIGTFKQYTNNQLVSTSNILLTGTPEDSKSLTRTWDQLNPGPPYRGGGPFASISFDLPSSQVQGVGTYSSAGAFGSSRFEYSGGFVDDGQWGADSSANYLSVGVPDLSGYDSRAWDELKPRVSKASLAQFIYELKDLPGQLETSANLLANSWRSFGGGYSGVVMHPKSVADNFLNHEFGWVPFISDLYNLFDVYSQSEKYISDLVAQNNTWVRKSRVLEQSDTEKLEHRGYSSGTDPSSGSFQIGGICNSYQLDGLPCKGHFDIRSRISSRVWAVGSFKYYRPEFDSSLADFASEWNNAGRLLTLYGMRINPTLIYKVTPWTWAVDWFSQFGKFIQRQDDFISDGIVSRFLYVMRETKRFMTKTSHLNFISSPVTLNWRRTFSMKQRKVADSPYGFDLTWNNLSIRHWSILAAIGITRQGSGFISRGA